MYPQGQPVRPGSYLNFQIPEPYSNQVGQILPTIGVVAPKFSSWLRPCIYVPKSDKSLLIIQKVSIRNYRCHAIKYSWPKELFLKSFLDTILPSRSLWRGQVNQLFNFNIFFSYDLHGISFLPMIGADMNLHGLFRCI